ncbi:hypothetical protein [Flavonifractor sp. An306]|uniref:LptM family lipoprotein n=1 Tax=Flavonifractor sp. An306 TaxID=1965629 RepID=UPI000B38C7B7|nr:hypothetical protein [Flavonifractor sp. An306]OUO44608.1 hypothetical protein B5F88_00685 [Flavonifractor sp. An306]
MKRIACIALALMMAGLSLTGCGAKGGGTNQPPASSQPTVTEEKTESKVVHGVINRIDNYLVLLTDDGEYQTMEYGEGITMDGFTEGDRVDVSYTGELGVDGTYPVITAITKTE